MEIHELRVGSLIWNVARYDVLAKNDFGFVRLMQVISPVDIDGQILLMLGFSFERKIGALKVYQIKEGVITIMLRNKEVTYVAVGQQRVDDGSVIKYAHRLQNLFYSLTNEEFDLTKFLSTCR